MGFPSSYVIRGNWGVYYRKSFFKGMDSFKSGKILFLLLQLFAVFFMLYNYNSGFVVLNFCSLLYFIFHFFHIKKSIEKHNAEISQHHAIRIKVYGLLLNIYIIFTAILMLMLTVFSATISVLWWVGAASVMLYSEALTISSVIAFSKNGYVSGDFFVKYDGIDMVRKEKNIDSCQGEIVWVTFWKDDKKIGFDKMFTDEYHKLRLQIYQK